MLSRPALLAALFAFAATAIGASEEPKLEEIDPKGKPTAYKASSGKCAIWQDKDGWHFRVAAKKNDQTFTGQIEAVDGKFTGVKLVAKGAPGIETKSKSIDVDFKLLKGSESGFDMKLDDSTTAIKFSLKVDGQEAPELILIGAKGKNPNNAEFLLPAVQKKK